MSNRGTDYGMGRTNVDMKTGIRFGVIPANAIGQAWYDEAEPGEYEDEGCFYAKGGYVMSQDSDYDVWVTKSPYYTRAQFCSPCAPGACYLLVPCDDGERAYCLGHDWFDNDEAPYLVYRVSNDTLVEKGAK